MNRSSRCLDYAGVDPEWEKRELRTFSSGAIRTAAAVNNYLLGRLMEEDLHISCKPMLPANVQNLNGSMVQGVCLLQIVDIVNIGANYEQRTEDCKGATRTLKLCLTDGHQTVSGFEFKWVPALTVKTPRGTKIIVQNVAVRHGMLLLTPETCQVVGASGNDSSAVASWGANHGEDTNEANRRISGNYAAALITAGSDLHSDRKTASETAAPARPAQVSPDPSVQLISSHQSISHPLVADRKESRPPPQPAQGSNSAVTAAPTPQPGLVQPPVFVDISSEEDAFESDVTDPMVEHLFYSPNTPRLKNEPGPPWPRTPSRKRPHPESIRATTSSRMQSPPAARGHGDVVDMTSTSPEAAPQFSLLPPQPTAQRAPTINLTAPFLYLNSRNKALTVASVQVGTVVTIRGFMKSVAGFQFNTGAYNLLVLIEDGTTTKEVRVEPALVQSLMGVPCSEFLQAMQRTPAVAHKWAAKMQVTLMTMQGIMRLRFDAAPDKWTLLECRQYTPHESHALLARIQDQRQMR